ncbi:hypothetical protein BSKO_11879 [Bryopsis sp. KO-2023]|nr:hypothetical protein BSKO_11879 [Bryopsis sp. KO-2023]
MGENLVYLLFWVFLIRSEATFTATLGDWQTANAFPSGVINWDAKRDQLQFVCLSEGWTGVTCSGVSIFASVDLDVSGLALTGPLAALTDVGLFRMQTLDLGTNLFTGALPASWSHLTALTSMDLSGNTLGGNLPEEWSNLQSLEYLSLQGNSALTGTIPLSWKTQLTSLTT